MFASVSSDNREDEWQFRKRSSCKNKSCFFFFFSSSNHSISFKVQESFSNTATWHLSELLYTRAITLNLDFWSWATCLFWTVTSTGCSSAIFMRGQHQNILKCHVAHSQTWESINILLTLSFYRPTINTIPLQHLPVHWWELSLCYITLHDSHFIFLQEQTNIKC